MQKWTSKQKIADVFIMMVTSRQTVTKTIGFSSLFNCCLLLGWFSQNVHSIHQQLWNRMENNEKVSCWKSSSCKISWSLSFSHFSMTSNFHLRSNWNDFSLENIHGRSSLCWSRFGELFDYGMWIIITTLIITCFTINIVSNIFLNNTLFSLFKELLVINSYFRWFLLW
jgi:hypothetical protein